ncbi:DUF3107 domain-containing protein [Microbacterium excoecariae]|uniref:DUF3107 domain-containing protein n=1 Tax=Microbacterium TaxID=33882 RepID=UPI001321611D|nr:DUF3107 family protein [Microbacterium sp. ZXX196]NHI17296.1 DUF3107 domain-containing protein [Microbacterium excoecariae]
MDIRIGMMNTGRELSFSSNETASDIEKKVADAISSGSAVSFSDVKGRTYVVPSSALAFVEVGVEETRRVGFVA